MNSPETSRNDNTRCSFLCILFWLVSLTVAFAFQGSRPLFGTSEGRYAECAREMLETGNYMEPKLDYQLHFSKPPLTYWSIVLGMKLLGVNEWGARFMHSLAFFLTALLTAGIASTWWDRRTGWLAGTIYATSLLPSMGAFALTTDTLLTLWETAAVWGYIKSLHAEAPWRRSLFILFMWLMFGAAFMTKGPPGLLPLIPILVYHFRFKPRAPLGFLPGWLVFGITGFSWYVMVCIKYPELVSYFLGQEVIGRLSGHVSGHRTHNAAWYKAFRIYLPPLVLGAGAWSYYLWKNTIRLRLWHLPTLYNRLKERGPAGFLLLWFLIPLFVFWFAPGKLTLYILPLSVPITLAVAGWIAPLAHAPGKKRSIVMTALISMVFLVGVKAVIQYIPTHKNIAPLLKTCRMLDSPDVTWVGFELKRWYNLQFYFNKRFIYCDKDEADVKAFNHVSCDRLFHLVRSVTSPFFVICRERKSVKFQDIAKSYGLSGNSVIVPGWRIILFNTPVNP